MTSEKDIELISHKQWDDIIKKLKLHINKLESKIQSLYDLGNKYEDKVRVYDYGASEPTIIVDENIEEYSKLSSKEKSDLHKQLLGLDKTITDLEEVVNQRKSELSLFEKLKDQNDDKDGIPVAKTSDSNQILNTMKIVSEIGVRARFVYQGETSDGKPIPVADSYVLYWKYDHKDQSKLAINPDKKSMRSIGIGKTDSEGYIYTSNPFYSSINIPISNLYYSPSTHNVQIRPISGVEKEAETHKQSLLEKKKKNAWSNPHIKMLTNFSKKFNTTVQDELINKNPINDWELISKSSDTHSIEFFDKEAEYGFMLCPPTMGYCEIKNIIDIVNQTATRENGTFPLAVKTKVESGKDIELFCNFREWLNRIDKVANRLSFIDKVFEEANLPHIENIGYLNTMLELVDTMEKYPYHTGLQIRDSQRLKLLDAKITGLRLRLKRKNIPEESRRKVERELEQALTEREPIKKAFFEYNLFARSIKKANQQEDKETALTSFNGAINDLIEGINERMQRPDLYIVDPESTEDKLSIAAYDAREETAAIFWNLITGSGFSNEYQNFIKNQELKRSPANADDIVFPIPSEGMKSEAYLDYLWQLIYEGYSGIKDSSLKETLKNKEFIPSFHNMAETEQAIELGKELEKQLEAEITTLKIAVDDNPDKEDIYNKQIKYIQHQLDMLQGKSSSTDEYAPPATEDTPTIDEGTGPLALLWKFYHKTKTTKQFLGITIVNSPGAPSLLQLGFDLYGSYIHTQIISNPLMRGLYMRKLVNLAYLCGYGQFSKTALASHFAKCLADPKMLGEHGRAIFGANLFFSDACYGVTGAQGKTPYPELLLSRRLLWASVCLKTTLSLLNMFSIYERFEKFAEQCSSGEIGEMKSHELYLALLQPLGAMADTITTSATIIKTINNAKRALSWNFQGFLKLETVAKITSIANITGIVVSVICAVIAYHEMCKALEQGKYALAVRKAFEMVQHALAAVGLLILMLTASMKTAAANFWNPIGIGCLVLSAIIAVTLFVIDLFSEKTSIGQAILGIMGKIEESTAYRSYMYPENGAKANTITPMKSTNSMLESVKFADLSWHAIIPLHNKGFNLEAIQNLFPPPERWSFAFDTTKDKVTSIDQFIKMYHDTVDSDTTFGTQLGREVADALAAGEYTPRYDNKHRIPEKYAFLEDPFFSVAADGSGISHLVERVHYLHHMSNDPAHYHRSAYTGLSSTEPPWLVQDNSNKSIIVIPNHDDLGLNIHPAYAQPLL